jgi:hypothetical protein
MATWNNQFGETQPKMQFNAIFDPQSGTWSARGPMKPDPAGCEIYEDPIWEEKAQAAGKARQEASDAAFNQSVGEDMSQTLERSAAQEAEWRAKELEAESMGADADAEEAKLTAGRDARDKAAQEASDRALAESLKSGPTTPESR